MRDGVVRIRGERAPEPVRGAGKVALLQPAPADVVRGRRAVRGGLQDGAKLLLRAGEVARLGEQQAIVLAELRVARGELHGAGQRVQSFVAPAAAHQAHAKEVGRLGVVRRAAEQRAIGGRGLVETAGLGETRSFPELEVQWQQPMS